MNSKEDEVFGDDFVSGEIDLLHSNKVKKKACDDVNGEEKCGLLPPVELMEKPVNKFFLVWKVLGALFFVVVLFLFLERDKLFGNADVDWKAQGIYFISMLLMLVVAMIAFLISIKVHIILHELGHALAGWLRGMRLVVLGVGPWRFELTLRGYRWRRANNIKGVSGFALMLPDVRQKHQYSECDRVVYLAGGSLMNLFCGALLCLWANFYLVDFPSGGFVLNVMGVIALFLGIANLVPYRVQGWRTDGLQIWDILRRKEHVVLFNMMRLSGLSLNGTRPRLWPVALLPDNAQVQDESLEFVEQYSAQQMRLVYALDVHDQMLARTCAHWLVAHFHLIPDGVKQQVAVSVAVYVIEFEDDKDLLAAWRPFCNGGVTNNRAVCFWLDAVYAWMCGDMSVAKSCLLSANEALPTVMSLSDKVVLEERIAWLKACMANTGKVAV